MEQLLKSIFSGGFSAIEIIAITFVITICVSFVFYVKNKTSIKKIKCIDDNCLKGVFDNLTERDHKIEVLLQETKKNNKILKLLLLKGTNENDRQSILQIIGE